MIQSSSTYISPKLRQLSPFRKRHMFVSQLSNLTLITRSSKQTNDKLQLNDKTQTRNCIAIPIAGTTLRASQLTPHAHSHAHAHALIYIYTSLISSFSLPLSIHTRIDMDPCPFVRIAVGDLALNLPHKPHLSFYSKFKLRGFPSQLSEIPCAAAVDARIHACFTLKKSELEKLAEKSSKFSSLRIEIYRRSGGESKGCGLVMKSGKLLGCVVVQLDLKSINVENRACPIRNGWVPIGGGGEVKLHMNVRAEPDPRFVFQFEGEPECSPQVFQINGNVVKQPVFTCNFSFRNCTDRNSRPRCSISTSERGARAWCLGSSWDEEEEVREERKGWSITIHDLSGSPAAAASMVTPFVPSPGKDSVGRSNPGAWLILRPGYSAWKPWGRLEVWRESASVCYRFELIPDGAADAIQLASSNVSTKTGGKFTVDITTGPTPMASPSSSFDFSSGSSDLGSAASGSGSWAQLLYRGFVMSSTVGGSKPVVEVGVQHVTCTEDAAAFVALAAAMDLSMDACRLFSQKLRKELRQPDLH
ncbi:uncharacterized protein LOC131017843 [Salvia miltiorrhiza]|uniref:uncharacterized protein LOC131017843 n=1 Tax=Salvia miltiorrhiza TaxID=226208 RepID=UPI0025AB94AA|nr:uncharacterized protein LOC131017843 [Salvia miltiorrhiza]